MAFLVAILFLLSPALGAGTLSVKRGVEREAAHEQDSEAADVYYLTRMGDRFLGFMAKHQEAVNSFGASEQDRLRSAIISAASAHDKEILEATARVNEENRLEAQNAFGEMRNFVTTLKQAVGAVGSASRCQDLTCGSHAYCTLDQKLGARCLCKEGYQGNGFICKTPTQFTVHSLMQFQTGQARPQVADIHVSTLQGDTIVAVYRDIANAHKGYALLGHASVDSMRWHAPVLFSNSSKAYSPLVVELQEGTGRSGGIAIAYRSADRGGDGILLGGHIDPATGKITLGAPRAFARHQAQAMAMLPLADSRVAVIFAEHIIDEKDAQLRGGAAMYGAALLAQVHSNGQPPEVINKDRFASGPVARLSATVLSPSLFAIAYRNGGGEPDAKQAEASCIAGQVLHNHIHFNGPAVLLEPEQTNIWSRSIARIGENMLSYTYHSGNERLTKQAILSADPKTHHLKIVHGPEVLARGFTPVVGSVALVPTKEELLQQKTGPFSLSLTQHRQQQSVRLLTYVGHDGAKPAQARLCGISSSGMPSGCQDMAWAGRDLTSVASTPISDGRFVFIFTDARGTPYYEFIGLSDPLI